MTLIITKFAWGIISISKLAFSVLSHCTTTLSARRGHVSGTMDCYQGPGSFVCGIGDLLSHGYVVSAGGTADHDSETHVLGVGSKQSCRASLAVLCYFPVVLKQL